MLGTRESTAWIAWNEREGDSPRESDRVDGLSLQGPSRLARDVAAIRETLARRLEFEERLTSHEQASHNGNRGHWPVQAVVRAVRWSASGCFAGEADVLYVDNTGSPASMAQTRGIGTAPRPSAPRRCAVKPLSVVTHRNLHRQQFASAEKGFRLLLICVT